MHECWTTHALVNEIGSYLGCSSSLWVVCKVSALALVIEHDVDLQRARLRIAFEGMRGLEITVTTTTATSSPAIVAMTYYYQQIITTTSTSFNAIPLTQGFVSCSRQVVGWTHDNSVCKDTCERALFYSLAHPFL